MRKILVILGASIILIILLIYAHSQLLVKNIQIISQDKQRIFYGADIYYNTSILLLRRSQVEKELLMRNPSLESIRVSIEYPQTLIIMTKPRITIAMLHADKGFLYLSSDSVVMSRSREKQSQLPLISYFQSLSYDAYQPGSNVELFEISNALLYIQKAIDYGLRVQKVDIEGEHVIRLFLDSTIITFTTEKESSVQVYEMQQIMKKMKLQGQEVKTIDLRFDKPVVTFK